MRVLVTGANGSIGRALVRRLLEAGYQVHAIDQVQVADLGGASYAVCDVTDYTALRRQVEGMEAIVHLAAIISPARGLPQDIYHVNTSGTFNVYQAAEAEGIQKIVCASSINSLGYNFGIKPPPIHYFPIDEEHPGMATDPYSLSKQHTESIADYFWRRRDTLSSMNLRMSGVYEESIFPEKQKRAYVAAYREKLERLLGRPEAERLEVVRRALQKYDQTRPERATPGSQDDFRKRGQKLAEDPDLEAAGFAYGGHSDFWTAVDMRDVCQAFEKSLLVDLPGSHDLLITDSHNLLGIESERLLGLFFPEVTARKRRLVGTESIVSIDRARKLIGFEPEFSIRQYY